MRNKSSPEPPAARITRFREMGIERKLMLIIMITTTAALLLSGVAIVIVDSLVFRGYLERDLSALARIISDNSTAALSFDDAKAEGETLAALKARTHLLAVCIYRADGSVLAKYLRAGTSTGCPRRDSPEGPSYTSSNITLARPIVYKGGFLGTLVMRSDLDEIYERTRLYGAMVLIILLGSSLVALLLSSRLQSIIATPISQLVHTATAVSQTKDYGIRAKKLSQDELGVLVDAFNEMLAGIQTRNDELKHALLSRSEALRAAQNARDSLKTTLASIGDAVISTDMEGRIVFANPAAQRLVRWPEDEITGQLLDQVFRVVNESSRAPMESPVTRVLREGSAGAPSEGALLIARDGAETPVDNVAAPIRGQGGTVHGIVLVFRDVTARRRADETSRLLASIVASSDDAIIGHHLDGRIASWNKGAEQIFGYSSEEMMGCPTSVIAAPGQVDEMPEILKRIGQGERVEQYQALRRTRDGKVIHMSITVSPLYDASGRIVGASKIARDITAQVRATDRLAQLNTDLLRSNEHLARSNEDLERFAFVASHDLQEPLRMISVYSQLLVKKFQRHFDGEVDMFVNEIVGGTTRMRDLLSDLLAYTQINRPEQDRAVDLNLLLAEVQRNLSPAIAECGATIICGALPVLSGYEGHLFSLFQNLLGNAIKYRSERPLRIHVSAQATGGALRFEVTDNGIGIAPDYHTKIFAAFKRLHGKNIPGTGIGLAICQRVVERHGGRIWVESQVDRGSTFIFTLPDTRIVSSGADAWSNERVSSDEGASSK